MSKKESKGSQNNKKNNLQNDKKQVVMQEPNKQQKKTDKVENKEPEKSNKEGKKTGQADINNNSNASKNKTSLSFLERIGCMLAKKYIRRLEQQMDEVKEDNKNELFKLESEYKRKEEDLNDKIRTLKEENEKLSKKIDAVRTEKEDLTKAKENLEKENLEKEKQYQEKDQKAKDELDGILTDIQRIFKDIKTDGMTIEEALKKIAGVLEEYKDKVKSAQDEVKSVKERNEKAEKELNDAKQRVTDIESSDKGALTLELENVRSTLDEKIALLADKDKEIGNLAKEKETADDKVKEICGQLDDEKKAHEDAVQKHKEESDELKNKHKEEIDSVIRQHKDKLAEQEQSHKAEVEKINNENAEKLRRKDEICDEKIASVRAAAEIKEKELNARIEAKDNTIAELNTILKSESDSIRNRTIEVANNLHSFLIDNEVMVACCDEYRDKVEDKLQDLIFNSGEMIKEISQLPQAATPSQWEATLQTYIVERIEENTSLINILLKYYTMSNVPFMIDAERDNGIYFVRKNIKEAYDAVVTILRQCNITPILPSLFVENISEGLYEAEGQFNDIESFCPGSINEHIEHIERSSEGLNNIIIGVTRVGYLIGNEKKIEAQVLIS